MAVLRVAAEIIYQDEGYDYNNFNCQHQDVKEFCEDAKKYADMEPVIHTSKDEYCAWIKLNSKENGKTKYMCIDDMGHLNETITNPGQRGFCDGTSFVCPSDELLLLK